MSIILAGVKSIEALESSDFVKDLKGNMAYLKKGNRTIFPKDARFYSGKILVLKKLIYEQEYDYTSLDENYSFNEEEIDIIDTKLTRILYGT